MKKNNLSTTSGDQFKKPLPARIDVMVPVANKDIHLLELALNNLLRNCKTPIRKIFIVCQENSGLLEGKTVPQLELNHKVSPNLVFVNEEVYPFSLQQIKELLNTKKSKDNHSG